MRVKICGLTDAAAVAAAAEAGAAYVGFVFFPPSPRSLSPEAAAPLAADVPPGVCKVALTVDADDAALEAILETVPLDMLQLHGKESPERVAEVRGRFGLPVMKAVGIAEEADLPEIAEHARAADQLLIDAKPPRNAVLPGGNGLAFDWRLLQGRRWAVPWMLAGGLHAGNVAEAARLTGVPVDLVKLSVYMLSSLMAGISAILMVGWLGSVTNALGLTYELRVIASTVIGGANLMGGEGTAFGAFVGAALIEVIRNSLLLAGVDPYWQGAFVGLFIILAVLLERVRGRRSG